MGGNTILKAVWFSFVISSGALLLNAAMDIEMIDSPAASKNLMVGERLELHWKFNVEESARNKWKISLYVYNYSKTAKDKLVILKEPGEINARKQLPPVYQRINLELSYSEAKMSIPTTTFDDTAAYGISFEPSTTVDNTFKAFEKVTDVTIVDMLLDEQESSTVLRTWIGQPVQFICTIVLRVGADSPSFAWKNVVKNMTITDNIFVTRLRSVLTVNPKDEDDFGSYKCYARTIFTKIKHNMTLLKIDYPGYPILVNFSPQKRSLTWVAPMQYSFIVQYLKDRATCKWLNVNTTSGLSISISSLSEYLTGNSVRTCSVRICFEGRDYSKNTSCSREHKVYSKISPAPTIRLTNDSSTKATLSWKRENGDIVQILGYVIQLFRTSANGDQKITSIHLDHKRHHGKYTLGMDKIKHALLRVCVRNTLCIYEKSCSRKVGLRPVFPSKPRSIKIKFSKDKTVSDVKITWEAPRVRGKGTIIYVVEVQKEGKVKWRGFTRNLYQTLTAPSLSDDVRVCTKNEVNNDSYSCSQSYNLGKAKLKNLELGSGAYSMGDTKFFFTIILTAMVNVILVLRSH